MKKMILAALVIGSMFVAACGKKAATPAKPTPGSAAPMGSDAPAGSGSAAPAEGGGGAGG